MVQMAELTTFRSSASIQDHFSLSPNRDGCQREEKNWAGLFKFHGPHLLLQSDEKVDYGQGVVQPSSRILPIALLPDCNLVIGWHGCNQEVWGSSLPTPWSPITAHSSTESCVTLQWDGGREEEQLWNVNVHAQRSREGEGERDELR